MRTLRLLSHRLAFGLLLPLLVAPVAAQPARVLPFTAAAFTQNFVAPPSKGNCDPRACNEAANCLVDGGGADIRISPKEVALGEILTITVTPDGVYDFQGMNWPATISGPPTGGRGGKFIRWQSETMCGGPRPYPTLTRVGDCPFGATSCQYQLTATGSMDEDPALGGRPWAIVRLDFSVGCCTAWDEDYFGVVGQPPEAVFAFEVPEDNSLQVDFDASASTDPDGQIETYAWDFDGDGTVDEEADAPTTSHVYEDEGTYTVTLTVRDNDGLEDTDTQQVTVEDKRLQYTVTLESEEVAEGDTLILYVEVRNTGDDPIEGIDIYGIPVPTPGKDGEVKALNKTPSFIAALAPDATETFIYRFLALKAGEVRFAIEGVDLVGQDIEITGQTDTEETVAVCDEQCEANVVILPAGVTITLKTDAAQGNALGVKSGLIYKPGRSIQMMEQIDPDGSLASINFVCRSGCVDVEVEVVEGDGMPVPDAAVTLEAPIIISSAALTPGGGYFCERTTSLVQIPACGNPLTLKNKTNEEGQVHAFYAMPGVVEDVPVSISAVVQRQETQITEWADLTIEPNLVVSDTETIGFEAAAVLNGTNVTIVLTFGIGIAGEFCKAALKGIVEPAGAGVKNATLNAGMATAVDYICSKVPALEPISAYAGVVKRVAEISQMFWFFSQLDVDLPGFVDLRPAFSPPFVDLENDFLAAVNEAFLKGGIQDGSIIAVKLYEMSYLDRNALINPFTPALYFTMDITPPDGPKVEYKKLMEGGTYDPANWLLPPQDQFFEDILSEGANTGDTQIRTNGGQASGGKQTAAGIQGFEVGDYIGISTDAETGEFNQILAIENKVLFLVAPLQHHHTAQESVTRLSAGTVVPPASPLLVPLSGNVEPTPLPPLEWVPTPFSFPMSYDLQLASDTTFTETLVDTTGLTTTTFAPGNIIWAGTTYSWRVRTINMVGEGAWSAPQRFTTRPTGVAVEDTDEVPRDYVLSANYPNPFNPQTTIPFSLPQAGSVRLTVYDVLGREVLVLVDETIPPGHHESVFEASGLPSGVYLYRLEAGGFTQTRRMLLLK